MSPTLIPIYNSERLCCTLGRNRDIRIEPWNRQIKEVKMLGDAVEDVPDSVAIIEKDHCTIDEAFSILHESGFQILPLIFEKAYFIYQIADTNSVTARASVSYSIFGRGNDWIKQSRLDDFLRLAVECYEKHRMGFALDLHYEIDFRSSSAEVKFLLHALLLEHLSRKFVDKEMELHLSADVEQRIMSLAEADFIQQGLSSSSEPPLKEKLNKLKENIKQGLTEKSTRQAITELLNTKIGLNVDPKIVSDITRLRGTILHSQKYSFEDLSELLRKASYINRIALISILTDFDPNFQRYIKHHTFPGFDLLPWEKF